MNTQQISKCLKNERKFNGVFAANQIPRTGKEGGYIINTENSSKPGQHWVAIYQDCKGKCEYFDSFGLPPIQFEIVEYISEFAPKGCRYNNLVMQQKNAISCGLYCIFFLKCKFAGQTLDSFVSLFCTNSSHNEILIQSLAARGIICSE